MAKASLVAASDAAEAQRSATAPALTGVGGLRTATVAILAAIAVGLVVGLATTTAVAAPLAVVAGLTVAAAHVDHRSGRIPNSAVLAAAAVLVAAWPAVAIADQRAMIGLGRDMLAGCVLSGAPVLFAIWVVAPRLIGGGDWKLLAAGGTALGLLTPIAAAAMSVIAFGAAIAASAGTRRRQIRLGPFLAVGFVVAAVAAVAAPELLASSYVGAVR